MFMFFWFFKQLYYILKRFFKYKLLLLIIFFIIFIFLFYKPSQAVNVTVPQVVIDKALTLCPHDNILILQDTVTGEFYIPYPTQVYNDNLWSQHGWLYAYRNSNQVGITTPDWYRMGLYVYRNNNFVTANLNNWNVSTIIDMTYNGRNLVCVYSTMNVIYAGWPPGYGWDNNDVYFEANAYPFITTPSADIVKWDFENFSIDGASLVSSTSYGDSLFVLNAMYNNVQYTLDITNYISNFVGSLTFDIPINLLLNGAVVRNGSSVTFSMLYYKMVEGGRQIFEYNLGSYTFDLTAAEEEQIQQNMSEQLLGSINDNIQKQTTLITEQTTAINNQTTKIQEQTNAINDQTDYLKDDSVDDSSIILPSDSSNDITQDGLNGIFTTIYNAFCTGEAQDIVFPIPFTNKNITLSANYVRNMLQNNGASWVITFVSAFWWYLISRFIIKDITNKITKIKSGNIEDIETSNIKGDML